MNPTKVTIIVKFQIEGLHYWREAELYFPQVSYLQYPHRHTFHIECEFEVTHLDRQREFIVTKHEIENYLKEKYYNRHTDCCDFGGMSCEKIAMDLYERFDLTSSIVSEDNEFSGKVVRKDYQTFTFIEHKKIENA